ncbi:hypothetical protein VTN96DRAFT_2347 [Rasamsonia emersonii]
MEESRSLDNPSVGAETDGQQQTTAGAELASAQPQRTAASPQQRPTHPRKTARKCRFFGTKKGCRAGDACPYLHEVSSPNVEAASGATSHPEPDGNPREDTSQSEQVATEDSGRLTTESRSTGPNRRVIAPKGVPKPIPKAQNDAPREYQIAQLRRRFHPKEQNDESGTVLTFGMAPTDPDFPFDMEELQCVLYVPRDYPGQGRPTLRVTNPDMPRGFQINVEKGFDKLVDSSLENNRQTTLLGLMNSLDRNLERFLIAEKAPTIKFVANLGSREDVKSTEKTAEPAVAQSDSTGVSDPPAPAAPSVQYSPEEKSQAEKTRRDETRQLEARLGRLSLYEKSPDGLSYVIPITPSKPDRLPESLRAVKTIKLVVPPLYPLEKSSIELQQVEGDAARATEAGFKKWVHESTRVTLMSQVNYLVHNMHILASTPISDDRSSRETPSTVAETKPVPQEPQTASAKEEIQEDRPHIKVIPRPPEWSAPEDTESESDFTTSDEEKSDEEEASEDEEEGGAPVPEPSASTPASTPARGVSLSFPGLELYGIELLEVKMLCVTLKCERCKEFTDVKNIKPTNDPSVAASVRAESCRKCANVFGIGFRRELMHPTSHRAGYLDLEGCTVFDLLPSHFVPTCSECSTPFPAPGIVAVRGESAFATCRECHRRMVFKIPEVKFLVVGPSALTAPRPPPRKKVKENLGIVAGRELPHRGRCSHYGKSYRWFRFSCCAKVFPCDKCHDAATDHPNEHANRMICGFCSREQMYRPEDCSFCRNVLVGKSGSGFWEGGKGTRDKVRMSRKDPRKYKRRGGTAASSSKKKDK